MSNLHKILTIEYRNQSVLLTFTEVITTKVSAEIISKTHIDTVNQWFSKLLGQDLEAEINRILVKLLKAVRTEVSGRLRGILQQDLLQVNQYLELSFQEQGEEVGRDMRSKVFQLPPQTNIIEVFEREDVDGRLLILGEPGSGKTTSLLKLATELITQDQQDLWQKIEANPEMRELAQKPLFLNLMMTAFQGEAIVSESQLFTKYIEEQLRRPLNSKKYPQGKAPYSDQDTKKWLTYLAGQLEADKLTVFLIEKIQPYWLNPGKERWVFRLIYGLIVGLIVGLILWDSKNMK